MPTSATGTSKPRGFTLLEVLVVLAIVAVLASVAALAVGGVGSRQVENTARRAAALLELACERAAITGRDVGVAVLGDGLRFGYLVEQGWQPVGDDPADPLRPRALGKAVRLSIEREGERLELAEDPPATPQLACAASGELTPFVLEVAGEADAQRWQVRGALDGTLALQRIDAGD